MEQKLFGKSKTGKVKEWIAKVDGGSIYIKYGYVGGKMQTTEVKAEPKNVGKKNETTAEEQAVKEFTALVKAQKDKEKYRETVEELEDIGISPMLAQKYDEKKVAYPCYVQPKLNGVRCLSKRVSENKFIFLSRKGTEYTTLDHLIPELKKIMEVGETLDGEVYIHGEHFQTIVSYVKKQQDNSSKLQYWIYDVVDISQNTFQRTSLLKERMDTIGFTSLVRVPTIRINNHEEMKVNHDKFVQRGFEGAIIRHPEGVYEYFRSKYLLKYKEFKDAEFKIVGYEQGKGLHEGCIVFKCEGKHKGKKFTFNVTPKFGLERRREMYAEADNFVGEQLTVRYQELSKDGVPIFPIGIEIRNYE